MLKLFTKQDIQAMIDKGLTLQQIHDEMSFNNIGQGYGYKSEEAFILDAIYGLEDRYICYIPEYCYHDLPDGTKQIDLDSCYTRKDFNELTKDKTQAEFLFESVDWQHPSTLWEEWDTDFELGKIAADKENVDHLMEFIAQEVPYRLKNYFDYNVSDAVIAQIIAEVQENTDVMFDYDKFDDFLRIQCESMLELDSEKINSIKIHLASLREQLNGAIEFAPHLVPGIEQKMRILQIKLNTELKKDFKSNNFINDEEKMKDFKILSKEEFLQSYSYLTEEEYENTKALVQQTMFVFDDDIFVHDDYNGVNGYLWATDALVNRFPVSEDKEDINFFADYNLETGEIKLTAIYEPTSEVGELYKSVEIALNSEEKTLLTDTFEQYCSKEYGKSCLALLNEARIEDGIEPLDGPTATFSNEYKVYKHFRDDIEFEKEFKTLNEALDYCFADDTLCRDDGHALSVRKNDMRSIFEINYYGNIEVDVDKCATDEELNIINNFQVNEKSSEVNNKPSLSSQIQSAQEKTSKEYDNSRQDYLNNR